MLAAVVAARDLRLMWLPLLAFLMLGPVIVLGIGLE
jgi:hypothetical protein